MGAKLCPSLRQRAAARPGFAKLGPSGLLLRLKLLPGKVRKDGNAEEEPSRTFGGIAGMSWETLDSLECPKIGFWDFNPFLADPPQAAEV